jgi:hypothetical protein
MLRVLTLPATSPPKELCAAPRSLGGSWSRDGVILFAANNELFRIADAGGAAEKLTLDDSADATSRSFPQFLADQRRFIYFARGGARGPHVRIGSLDSPATRPLVDTPSHASYAAPYLLFVRGTTLMAQELDLATEQLHGDAVALTPNVAPRSLSNFPMFSANGAGVLAAGSSGPSSTTQLEWYTRDGRHASAIAQPDAVEYINPAISPDGNRVVANRLDPLTGNWDIWLIDERRGIQVRLTTDPARDTDAIWSREGTAIFFSSNRDGHAGVYRKIVDGVEPEALVAAIDDVEGVVPNDISPDGRFLLYSPYRANGIAAAVWVHSFADRTSTPLLRASEAVQYAARFSPDGKWVAYASSESGRFDVYVRPFMRPGARLQISKNGGTHPRWVKNGREIIFSTFPGGISSAAIDVSAPSPRSSEPSLLVSTPVLSAIDFRTHYDTTADGERFLMRRPTAAPPPAITVTLNWTSRFANGQGVVR